MLLHIWRLEAFSGGLKSSSCGIDSDIVPAYCANDYQTVFTVLQKSPP